MKKQIFHRITALLFLATILVPISIQFVHSFQEHHFRSVLSDEYDQIQHVEKNCAVFHHQINFNAIDLSFHFKLKSFQFITPDVQLPETLKICNFSGQKSSRGPPASFV
ncbi:MAG: hypothetical protein DSY82_09460 [Flavobacteriia bacterium]|nr:MAG: hypothetical protein DSY82_09460 [Flavobacteriia bacterium]